MLDVFGLGNALVDTEVNIDESFLNDHGITKGHMTLVDTPRMQALVADLTEQKMVHSSGGSAANTIYAIQCFGYRTAYACKVADDQVGRFFLEDMSSAGIELNPNAVAEGHQSGQCLVLITDDADRTMNTDLGISSELSHDDVDFTKLQQARYFYVEGYLSSSPSSTAATIACRKVANEHRVATAVSLSDPSMVEFFREPLAKILGNGVDVIFCNEEEALAWAKTDRIDLAIAELKDIAPELYITLGATGSLVVSAAGRQQVNGYEAKAIDTTGAGDMYAGACLAARCAGATPQDAARFANFSASSVVAGYGARLESAEHYRDLKSRF